MATGKTSARLSRVSIEKPPERDLQRPTSGAGAIFASEHAAAAGSDRRPSKGEVRRPSMVFIGRFASIATVVGCLVAPLLAQQGQEPYKLKDPGVVAPAVIKEVKPTYTAEAREKKIQGVVELEAVVLEDGRVGEVTMTKSLDETY